jgi:hypothetical protein
MLAIYRWENFEIKKMINDLPPLSLFSPAIICKILLFCPDFPQLRRN